MKENWYLSYIAQLDRHSNTGMVGSTINFSGYPLSESTSCNGHSTHIQTYVYLARWATFKRFVHDFPGSTAETHREAVENGEIALSRKIMAHGQKISCLQWPEYAFSEEFPTAPGLSMNDIKTRSRGDLPFRYKFDGYKRSFISLWFRSKTMTRMGLRLIGGA